MKIVCIITALCGVICNPPTLASGVTWHVDGSVSESGDGRSPESPFKAIREGIAAASEGDTIIVAEWTYFDNVHFKGKNIRLVSTDPLDLSVVRKTIIDGYRFGSVVAFSGTENETCLLSGFTIRYGKAQQGAGIYGGPYESRSRATISHNLITNNSASADGGGLCNCIGMITDNIIINNSAGHKGGGFYQCDGIIRNCTVEENSAWKGGGVSSCDDVIENCSISRNTASNEGGGLYDCDATIHNCTIYDNSAAMGGGGLAYCEGIIRNCIIWGNRGAFGTQLHGSSFPTYSCIHNWDRGGEGNLPDDPLFVDAASGDYHLRDMSPCINAGANYHWYLWPQRDLDGDCRAFPRGERVDMGCYEYGSSPDTDGDLLSDAREIETGTNPSLEDTDGDGLRDGLELLRETDPLVRTAPETIHVPADRRTIQEAILFAVRGDEIIVSPGTYRENIHFCGVDIVVRSVFPEDFDSIASTILDGGGSRPVVCFMGSETEACELAGLTIRNGKASYGGGILGRGTIAAIHHNWIVGNAAWGGGGLAFCGGPIGNNLIVGNTAWGYGGALYRCSGTVSSNTITANTAQQRGGGLYDCDGLIGNCILWRNTAPTGDQLYDSTTATFSCIQKWTAGGDGNIATDPLFVDPYGPDGNLATYEDNNYRLSPDSPCIDTGRNSDWMWEAVDLDGNSRIFHGVSSLTVDMGAYEYPSIRPVFFTISSPHGSPDPSPGTYTYWSGDIVPGGSVASLAYADEQGVRYPCVGYTGTGSAPSGDTNSYPSFRITEDSELTWNWMTQYRTTSSAGRGGFIAPEGESWYDERDDATFIADPNEHENYTIDKWFVDGEEVPVEGDSLTLWNIEAPHEVRVMFKRVPSITVRSNVEAPYEIRRLPERVPFSGQTQPTSDPKVFETVHRNVEVGNWEITWLPRADAWPRRAEHSPEKPVTEEMLLPEGGTIEFSKDYIVKMLADVYVLEKRIDYAKGTFFVYVSITNVTGPENPPARTFTAPIWLVVKGVVFTISGPHSEGRLVNPDGVTSEEYPDSGDYHYVDVSHWAPLAPGETSPKAVVEFYIKDRNPNFEPVIEVWAYDPVTDLDLVAYQVSIDPDVDGDGIPDAWERVHGLPTNSRNDKADQDGDGRSDLEEYVAGTVPTHPESYFCVTHFASLESGAVSLSWEPVPSRVYVVESADSPTGPWIPISREILCGAGPAEWTELPSEDIRCRFYRVRVSFP